jgi:hypothetical protein
MPKKQMTYRVRATVSVAEEMARYEGSTILAKSSPKLDSWIRDNPDRDPDFDADLRKNYTTYVFLIQGTPNFGRWRSFDIIPTTVEA